MNTIGEIFVDRASSDPECVALRHDELIELSKQQAEFLKRLPQDSRVGYYANNFTNVGPVGSKMLKALRKKNKNFQVSQ